MAKELQERERRYRADFLGLGVPVIDVGPAASEEAVVFVHGNFGAASDWLDLQARVGSFARAVAFDLPGYSGADKPSDWDYSSAGYGYFLTGLLKELGLERVHLVGHDFGGGWGLMWAALNPDQLASVVLINTGILIDYRWHVLGRIYRTPLLGQLAQMTTTRAGFRLGMRFDNPRGLPREFVDRMYDDLDWRARQRHLRLYRSTPANATERLSALFRELNPPALVVWGAHDKGVPVEQAERQRQSFPRAEVSVLRDSGHWPFIDDPEGTAEVVVPWLERQVREDREAGRAAASSA